MSNGTLVTIDWPKVDGSGGLIVNVKHSITRKRGQMHLTRDMDMDGVLVSRRKTEANIVIWEVPTHLISWDGTQKTEGAV